MMMKENYKIENHEDSSFQNFSSRIVFRREEAPL
jgi:hypothetical protein